MPQEDISKTIIDKAHHFKKKLSILKKSLTKLEWESYLLIETAIFLAIMGFIISKYIPYLNYFGELFYHSAIGFFIAGLLEKVTRKHLINSLSINISEEVIKNFKNIGERMLPNRIYRPTEHDWIEETRQCLKRSELFRFMSISAGRLLTDRLPNSLNNRNDSIIRRIELLLLDPTDDVNLAIRKKQMDDVDEQKSLEELKNEIIKSIFITFCLKYKFNDLSIEMRFHTESPICRLEFCAGNLFLQYYRSQQKSDKPGKINLGPILKYESDRDVYHSFDTYYRMVWGKCKKVIDVEIINNSSEINNIIEHIFPGLSIQDELGDKNVMELCNVFYKSEG